MKNSLVSNRNMWLSNVLEARLQSAEEECGRLVAAVMAEVSVGQSVVGIAHSGSL